MSFGEIEHKRLDAMKHASSAVLADVEKVLLEQFERAKAIGEADRGAVALLSKSLIDRKSLTGEEVRQVIEDMKKPRPSTRRRIQIDE